MDNVLKNIIHKEVNLIMNNKLEKNSSDSQDSPATTNATTSKKTTTRLGSLINRMRKGSPSTSKPIKSKKLQLKWSRFDPMKECFSVVRAKDGGGYRFLKVEEGETTSFADIKSKAVTLYFDKNDYNSYMEHFSECIITICAPSGEALLENDDLWDYLDKKGLFLSKCWFSLQTKCIDYQQHQTTFDINSTGSSDVNDKFVDQHEPLEKDTKRKICSLCSHTYLGNDCLICIQNEEFNLTSIFDYNYDLSNKVTEEHEPCLSMEELREKRLQNFSNSVTQAIPECVVSGEDSHNIIANQAATAQRPEELEKLVKIHRMTIKKDLIQAFITYKLNVKDKISYCFIDQQGNEELGIGTGVVRDVYSSFWLDVLECYFIGQDERVPFVRHDLYFPEWEAIGKILIKGFQDCGYFPVQISRSFMNYCLFNENNDDELLNSFFQYVAVDERHLLQEALSTNDETFFKSDDIADFLDQFKCRSMISSANIRSVLMELARQEIIQKPHLMATCWRECFLGFCQSHHFISPEALKDFYQSLEPTNKKVLAIFDADPLDDGERECFGHLKRYVRGLDTMHLKKLLRFLTGTDLMIIDKISINFTKQSGFSRRPIAHTCGPTLELSSTYGNFCELREEFSNVLQQPTWEMDIV